VRVCLKGGQSLRDWRTAVGMSDYVARGASDAPGKAAHGVGIMRCARLCATLRLCASVLKNGTIRRRMRKAFIESRVKPME